LPIFTIIQNEGDHRSKSLTEYEEKAQRSEEETGYIISECMLYSSVWNVNKP
ncbi:hypothetical protein ACTXT7_010392, partial [Hymenolepis weldensis]